VDHAQRFDVGVPALAGFPAFLDVGYAAPSCVSGTPDDHAATAVLPAASAHAAAASPAKAHYAG
jgi:hypothetical protein